jgi:hypothetical protein
MQIVSVKTQNYCLTNQLHVSATWDRRDDGHYPWPKHAADLLNSDVVF